MPSKNDLSSLKATNKPKILPESRRKQPSTLPAPRVESPPPAIKTRKVGRPKKRPEEKRDYKITLSLTKSEGKIIQEKAGLANEATYLYAILKENGVFK